MIKQPAYFEQVRLQAAKRWQQLEADPDLAAPWHQLFKQVQSPRHVLSELLQNADDAGATEASVRFEKGVFVFEHNGEDFTEDNFASLCRFGYSNKRLLHTIGFRGIGFKSTFSLGDTVELFTPTLTVSFHRQRFTEPRWVVANHDTGGRTQIRVEVADKSRRTHIEQNLKEWLSSPLSLIFFRHIRRLQIGREVVHWESLGQGPIANSLRMALRSGRGSTQITEYLIIKSAPEAFPREAIAEIRQERMVDKESDLSFPDSTVEIVLGLSDRLFVVLPTDVETRLPFACNAPFIQDPARLKIKDPATSPTNRWLLERAGRLAASSMIQWLRTSSLSTEERARAYQLLPDRARHGDSVGEASRAIVMQAFEKTIENRPLLLTDSDAAVRARQCVIIPREIASVWSVKIAAKLFDPQQRPSLSQKIREEDQRLLVQWELVERIEKSAILRLLQRESLPRPQNWRQLLALWSYVGSDVSRHRSVNHPDSLHIVPVQGSTDLHRARDIVRLGEKRALRSERDWQFLAKHLRILDKRWPQFLAEHRREAEKRGDGKTLEAASAAQDLLVAMGLGDTSDFSKVIGQVAEKIFVQTDVQLADCVQLAQIAAKQAVAVGQAFRFFTRDGRLQPSDQPVIAVANAEVERLVPESHQGRYLLHTAYTVEFASCSADEWSKWVASGRAALRLFVPFEKRESRYSQWHEIERFAQERGLQGNLVKHYKREEFRSEDWDFPKAFVEHWRSLAAERPDLWQTIFGLVLRQSADQWSSALNVRLVQVAQQASRRQLTHEPLPSAWVVGFRSVPCLPDTRGNLHLPGDLMLRSPETEPLLDVEPFVHSRLDTPANRQLLELLGVRTTASGPEPLLARLRELAAAARPSLRDVERIYNQLDRLVDTCSADDLSTVVDAFQSQKLIRTADGHWATVASVFLQLDHDDIPGLTGIHPAVRNLAIWQEIGVAEHATAEHVVGWLGGLPTYARLPNDDLQRTKAVLARYPQRIWHECSCWLNLAGELVPIAALRYKLTDQMQVQRAQLYDHVCRQVADLQSLPREVVNEPVFSSLLPLAQHIEERIAPTALVRSKRERHPWLITLAGLLERVELATDEEQRHVRELASRLRRSEWQVVQRLEVLPFLEGAQAGRSHETDVAWIANSLYVTQLPKAKLARRLPEAIGMVFGRDDLMAALSYCFDRTPAEVEAYLIENFVITALDVTEQGVVEPQPEADSVERPAQSDTPSLPPATSNATVDKPDEEGTPALRFWPPDRSHGEAGSLESVAGASAHSEPFTGAPHSTAAHHGEPRTTGTDDAPRQRSKLRTYVAPTGQSSEAANAKENGQELDARISAIDRAGIAQVLRYEREAGRYPREMPHENPGYDIESCDIAGAVLRYIEVKSIAGRWDIQGVGLSAIQFSRGHLFGEQYWLYVVERAEQLDARIYRVQDPVRRVAQYFFDDGWRDLAEGEAASELAGISDTEEPS